MAPFCVVGHRQHGEGPRRKETLVGDAAMRAFVGHGADDRRLLILPAGAADTRCLPQWRSSAVRADKEFGRDCGAAFQVHRHPSLIRVKPFHGSRRPDGDGIERRKPLVERAPDHLVFDDEAHGRIADVGMIEMQEEGRVPIGNTNIEDGRGGAGHAVPRPDCVQRQFRAMGNGGCPPVVGGRRHRREIFPVEQQNGKARTAQCHGKGCAHHAAADNAAVKSRPGPAVRAHGFYLGRRAASVDVTGSALLPEGG